MNDHETTATISLSQEELVYILRQINVQSLPGMGNPPLGQIEPEVDSLLLDAAKRALIARKLITFKDHTPQIDRGVQVAAAICAYPDQALIVISEQADKPVSKHCFYRAPELAVTHTFPTQGLHTLELGTTSDMGITMIGELVQALAENGMTNSSYTLHQSDLAQAQKVASQNNAEATQDLTTAGMAPAHAQALAQTLVAPSLRLVLQYVYHITPDVEQKILTLVAGKTGCWLIEAKQLDADQVVVQSMTARQAMEAILNAHKPLLEPLNVD